jgi:NitT/TauT family transport system ATP-binding protein
MAPSTPATPMIDVAGLRKTYSTRDGAIVTLDGVSFSVAAQEFVSVLGPSGCGKTTVHGFAQFCQLLLLGDSIGTS